MIFPFLTRWWFDLVEGLLVGVALLCAWRCPNVLRGSFEAVEAWLSRFAESSVRSVLIAAAVPMALRLLLLPLLPIPRPLIHDEFSHLLAGDTFAHGRLANPPHPHWEFFESFHILHHPYYASMEPPAQGLFLAAGETLLGDPWFGVWLSAGCFCGALCWALRQWVSPPWALFGALLAGLRWGIVSYWMNSYWGGFGAAFGGALAFGACGALARKPAVRPALLLGLGWSVLAASRPLEGFLASLPILVFLLAAFLRSEARADWWRKTIVPCVAILALGMGALLAYDARITGNALLPPNQANRKEYAVVPYFKWESRSSVRTYRHDVMRRFYYEFEKATVDENQAHPFAQLERELYTWFAFFPGVALLIPLVAAFGLTARGMPGGRAMLAAAIAAPWLSQILTNSGLSAHYHAPILAVVVILVVLGLRKIRQSGPPGLFFSRALPLVCVITLLLAVALRPFDVLRVRSPAFSWFQSSPENRPRGELIDSLRSTGGKHLVFVSYAPNHDTRLEWVYNGADLLEAPILWARDMGPEKNAQLIRDMPDRMVWVLQPDRDPTDLRPYGRKESLP